MFYDWKKPTEQEYQDLMVQRQQSFARPDFISIASPNQPILEAQGYLPHYTNKGVEWIKYNTIPENPFNRPQGQPMSVRYDQAQVMLQQSFRPENYSGTIYIQQQPQIQQQQQVDLVPVNFRFYTQQPSPDFRIPMISKEDIGFFDKLANIENYNAYMSRYPSSNPKGYKMGFTDKLITNYIGFTESFSASVEKSAPYRGIPISLSGDKRLFETKVPSNFNYQGDTIKDLNYAFPMMVGGTVSEVKRGEYVNAGALALSFVTIKVLGKKVPLAIPIGTYFFGKGVMEQGFKKTATQMVGIAPFMIAGEYAFRSYVVPIGRKVYMEGGTALSVFETQTKQMFSSKRASLGRDTVFEKLQNRVVPKEKLFTPEMVDRTLAGENFFQESPPIRGADARFNYIKGLFEKTRVTRNVPDYQKVDIQVLEKGKSPPENYVWAVKDVDKFWETGALYGKFKDVSGYTSSRIRGLHLAPDLLKSLVVEAGRKTSGIYFAVKGRGQLYFAFLETKFPKLTFSFEGGRTANVPIAYDIGFLGIKKIPKSIKSDASFGAIEKFSKKAEKGYLYESPDFRAGKLEEQALLLVGNEIALNLKTGIGKKMGFEKYVPLNWRFDIGYVSGRALAKGEKAVRGERVVTTEEFFKLKQESSMNLANAKQSYGKAEVGLKNVFSTSNVGVNRPLSTVARGSFASLPLRAKSSYSYRSFLGGKSLFATSNSYSKVGDYRSMGVSQSSNNQMNYGEGSKGSSYPSSSSSYSGNSDFVYDSVSQASSTGSQGYIGYSSYGTYREERPYYRGGESYSYEGSDRTYEAISRASYSGERRGERTGYTGYGSYKGGYKGGYSGYRGGRNTGRIISPPTKTSYENKDEGKKRGKTGFEVFVKMKGKFLKVSKAPQSFLKSVKLGEKVTDLTTARTYQVKNLKGQKVNVEGVLGGKFRPSKSKKTRGVGVEKSKYAIDSFGEKQGITVKGWIANRNKKWKKRIIGGK